MKKVVASLVLASMVSSSVAAVDVIGGVHSTSAGISAFVTKNPKTVGLSAVGVLVAGSALVAYKYPEGRTRGFYKGLDPRSWSLFGGSSDDKDGETTDETTDETADETTDETADKTPEEDGK